MRKKCAQDAFLTDYAHKLIRFKSRQLSQKSGFTRSDQDDLEQDLWAVLLSQADAFDPDRASIDTFIDRVVHSGVLMILRDRHRQKRANGFHAQSIDAPSLRNGDQSAANSGPDDTDRARHRGATPQDPRQLAEDQEATQSALKELPAPIHEVCRRVMGGSISLAARELGQSRRQIRNALAEARAYFERAGFGDG